MVGQKETVKLLARGIETLGVKEYCSCFALKKAEFWFPLSEVSFPKPQKWLASPPEAQACRACGRGVSPALSRARRIRCRRAASRHPSCRPRRHGRAPRSRAP